MSLITTVDGIPLYTTIQEAVSWAMSNNLRGYHEHIYKEQKGYMGAESHEIAVEGPVMGLEPVTIPISDITTTPDTTTTTPTYIDDIEGAGDEGGY